MNNDDADLLGDIRALARSTQQPNGPGRRDDRVTDHYGLREYAAARAANRIIEGDEPETDRARVDALIAGTRKVAQMEREWAANDIASGKGATLWCARYGRVVNVASIDEFDALQASSGRALRADA
jgi:hypothetical protein